MEQQNKDMWQNGNAYDMYIGRWSRRIAPLFLEWLNISEGRSWLDIGCGTGELSNAILEKCSPDSLTGIEPSDGFIQAAINKIGNKAKFLKGTATAIPLADSSADVVVSGLVINFVEKQSEVIAEMKRVTANDGVIAAYVWDINGKMDIIKKFWEAAVKINPAAKDMDEGAKANLTNPDELKKLFDISGLVQVSISPLDIKANFTSFDDYWNPFLGGQGPAPSYLRTLGDNAKEELRKTLHSILPINHDGTMTLSVRAWAVKGTVRK